MCVTRIKTKGKQISKHLLQGSNKTVQVKCSLLPKYQEKKTKKKKKITISLTNVAAICLLTSSQQAYEVWIEYSPVQPCTQTQGKRNL